MRATVMFGAGDVRIENIPDARINEPTDALIIAADILRIKDGILVEHWDVIQDEASRESSKSGLAMFGEEFDE
jgi:predicted SnoaL-like aldol condensation-catalyzing enzyme